jgi:hypothetical protein
MIGDRQQEGQWLEKLLEGVACNYGRPSACFFVDLHEISTDPPSRYDEIEPFVIDFLPAADCTR